VTVNLTVNGIAGILYLKNEKKKYNILKDNALLILPNPNLNYLIV
jgi:hypothetical protein